MLTTRPIGSGASLASLVIAGTIGGVLEVLACRAPAGIAYDATSLLAQSSSVELREVKRLGAGRRPGSVALADVNGDRTTDLLVASLDDGTLTVWLGNGRGGFRVAPAAAVSLGPRPTDVVAADFNRDGRLDVACANHETDHVSVLLGDGSGAFTPARGSPIRVQSQPHPHGIAAADVDGDARLDLVTESRDTSTIEILAGNGDGTFRNPGWLVPVAAGPYHRLRAADLDGDGRFGIVVPSQASDTVTIVQWSGADTGDINPRWRATRIPVPRSPFALTARDLDGDGGAEIAIAHFSGSLTNNSVLDGVSIAQRSGAERWRTAASLLGKMRGRGPVAITSGNFLGDRRRFEVAVAHLGTHNVELLLFDTGRLQAIIPPIPVGEGPLDIAAADLDGDGIDEIVTADSGANSVSVIFLK
jgi:hypothetical protein